MVTRDCADWSATLSATYNRSRSILGILGQYDSASGNARLSRKIRGSLHLVMGYSIRRYGSETYSNYGRLVHEGTVGLGFTPGEIPLRIW